MASACLKCDQAKKAHELLLDLMNNVPPTPEQVRLIARAASQAGEEAEAYYYLSEYRLMIGDLTGGISYLQQALRLPELQEIQRARFEARIDFIQEFMSEEQLKQLRSSRRVGLSRDAFKPMSRMTAMLLVIWCASGCAAVPPGDPVDYDPWEKMNRSLYQFNEVVDSVSLKPIAKGYKKVLPEPIRNGVTNFGRNLGGPRNVTQ